MAKRLASKQPPRGSPRTVRSVPVAGLRLNRFHRFLRRLSAGGRSNMYGAIPYLMHAFGVDREHAFRIVCEWLDQQEAEAEHASNGASPLR